MDDQDSNQDIERTASSVKTAQPELPPAITTQEEESVPPPSKSPGPPMPPPPVDHGLNAGSKSSLPSPCGRTAGESSTLLDRVFQTFYEVTSLSSESPSQISWIGSLQAFLLIFIGVFSGPLYDAGYFWALNLAGNFLVCFGLKMTSVCQEYWQVILAQGIVNITWKTYLVFGVFCTTMTCHIFFTCPETARKTLEEIDILSAWKSAAVEANALETRAQKIEQGVVDEQALDIEKDKEGDVKQKEVV